MALHPYYVMMSVILILTPLTLWFFTRNHPENRTPFGKIGKAIHKNHYYLHIAGYMVIIYWKGWTDDLNEPIKYLTGNYTDWVYVIEGNTVLWIQQTFENQMLNHILNFHYLFIYLFIIYVTTVYFAFVGERDLTDKVTLNYLLIYAIAVPYYLIFNVEVTSSWIPGMKALLYHDGWYTSFYVSHDPLDNCIPSLHIAIPFGILMLNWLHVKEKGMKLRDWDHWNYHLFILLNTILFCFSILYLGIHWIVDIPLGVIVGAIGALFIHYIQPRLRGVHGKVCEGITKNKLQKHILTEGAIVAILFGLLLTSINYQSDFAGEQATMRLGPEDTTYDIIQPIKFEERVDIEINNLDSDNSVYAIILPISKTDRDMQSMKNWMIDWDFVNETEDYILIEADSSIKLNVTLADFWHLIIMHNPEKSGDALEISIISDYHENKLWIALLMSIPSLWMTGFVVYRIIRLKQSKSVLYNSLPSHTWNNEKANFESE